MENSIFMDKSQLPKDAELRGALGDKYELWMESETGYFKNTRKESKNGIFPERSMDGAFGSRIKKGPSFIFCPGIVLSRQPLYLVAEPWKPS